MNHQNLWRLTGALALLLTSACATPDDYDARIPGFGDEERADFSEAELIPHVSDGPYAELLAICAVAANDRYCSLAELPLLGMTASSNCSSQPEIGGCVPSVDEILKRVVVSHPWMGQRFEEFLEESPAHMRSLFRGTTAIVIADGVRPSFYRAFTAAIYLDPETFWVTEAERLTVGNGEDYRDAFGEDLQFRSSWRYVIDGKAAWTGATDEASRRSELPYRLSRLLFHELAHANDCYSPANLELVDKELTSKENIESQVRGWRCLNEQIPDLESTLWYDLAGIFFHGDTPSKEFLALAPEIAGTEFEAGVAIDPYSYSSKSEDVAIAFETTMMKATFDADREVVLIDQQSHSSCQDAQVFWGQRGRLTQRNILRRSLGVVVRILPDFDRFAISPSDEEPPRIDSYCLETTSDRRITMEGWQPAPTSGTHHHF